MRRRYATDIADLWSAWTEPARTARWLGVLSGDRREGGTVTLCMTPPDADVATIDVIHCDAPHRLAVRWRYPGEPDSLAELRLVAVGQDETDLVLEHLPLTDELTVAYGTGWEDFLLRLDAFVAGGAPPDHAVAHLRALWTGQVAAAGADDRWPVVDEGTIRVVHDVPAPVESVWSAITDAAALGGWFGTTSGDLAPGGSWTVTWDQGSASGTVLACEPERRLSTTWRWAHEADRTPSTVSVTLEVLAPGTTRVTVVEEGAGPAANGYAAGWYAHLQGLARHLTGGDRDEAAWDADWERAIALLRA